MKQLCLLFTFLLTNVLFAQELPQFIQDQIDFCDSNLSNEQVVQLKEELGELEAYFINHGLLKDNSGASYRAVYEKIVRENDLTFVVDQSFELLDTLIFEVSANCFYKLLSQEQLSQLTNRHQLAAERISAEFEGEATPGLIAQRIIDNLTNEDFDLEFYRISSLLAFYKISSQVPPLTLELPPVTKETKTDFETIEVLLNEQSEIEHNGKTLTLEELKVEIYNYLTVDPQNRGIGFTPSRSASYEMYIQVIDIIRSVYDELENDLGEIPRNIVFRDPK